jgi:hypothetical protein
MKLSPLQKYILKQCVLSANKSVPKKNLERFYEKVKIRPKPKDLVNDVTKSVERLIQKELLVGYGSKTAYQWHMSSVKLTPKGRKVVKGLFGFQQKLPFKK